MKLTLLFSLLCSLHSRSSWLYTIDHTKQSIMEHYNHCKVQTAQNKPRYRRVEACVLQCTNNGQALCAPRHAVHTGDYLANSRPTPAAQRAVRDSGFMYLGVGASLSRQLPWIHARHLQATALHKGYFTQPSKRYRKGFMWEVKFRVLQQAENLLLADNLFETFFATLF